MIYRISFTPEEHVRLKDLRNRKVPGLYEPATILLLKSSIFHMGMHGIIEKGEPGTLRVETLPPRIYGNFPESLVYIKDGEDIPQSVKDFFSDDLEFEVINPYPTEGTTDPYGIKGRPG